MLDIFLGILMVLGILLLALAALALTALLLILFFPLSYRVCGFKDPETFGLTVKVRWLFGLVRAVCRYPDPGRLKVKALCFTLYDEELISEKKEGAEGKRKKAKADQEKRKKRRKKDKARGQAGKETSEQAGGQDGKAAAGKEAGAPEEKGSGKESCEGEGPFGESGGRAEIPDENLTKEAAGAMNAGETSEAEGTRQGPFGKLKEKIQKIKFTFCTLYDKIKKIWENISYYINLLQEEETKLLLSESLTALGRMLKSIGPRRIKADIRFGTGAPDTTGYIYGLYCMLSAAWIPGFLVTPDFEKKVLEGEFDLSGRITVWILLTNGLKMYKLIRRLKAAKKLSA